HRWHGCGSACGASGVPPGAWDRSGTAPGPASPAPGLQGRSGQSAPALPQLPRQQHPCRHGTASRYPGARYRAPSRRHSPWPYPAHRAATRRRPACGTRLPTRSGPALPAQSLRTLPRTPENTNPRQKTHNPRQTLDTSTPLKSITSLLLDRVSRVTRVFFSRMKKITATALSYTRARARAYNPRHPGQIAETRSEYGLRLARAAKPNPGQTLDTPDRCSTIVATPLARQRRIEAQAVLPLVWRPARSPCRQPPLTDGLADIRRGGQVQVRWRIGGHEEDASSAILEVICPEYLAARLEGVRLGREEQAQLGLAQAMLFAPGTPLQVQPMNILRAAQRERHTQLPLLPLVIEGLPAGSAQLDQPLPGWGVGWARPFVEVAQVIVQQVLIERLDAAIGDFPADALLRLHRQRLLRPQHQHPPVILPDRPRQ